jgi:hypothetical protein
MGVHRGGLVSNRAAVYTVRVHPIGQPNDRCLLGDFDSSGTALIDRLSAYLPKLNYTDESRKLLYLRHTVEPAPPQPPVELLAMLESGQAGMDAMIRSKQGEQRYHQVFDDSADLECGCLFRLPRNQRLGFLALHIPNRRMIKTPLAAHISRSFRSDYPELVLEITPYVVESALVQAVDQNLIETITLVRRVQPSDRASAGIAQWVGDEDLGKITVTIGASLSGRARHLLADPLRRFLGSTTGSHDRDAAKRAIVEFMGMTFDEAKVVVPQGDTTRTFNIEELDSGHPLTEDMLLPPGRPSEEAIFAALRRALSTVSA